MSRRQKKPILVLGVPGSGRGYNRLKGDDRQWAIDNQMPRSERCIPVKDGKRFSGDSKTKQTCGDGTMGFTTRRKGQAEVHLEQNSEGGWKKKRHSLVRPKSARATASRISRRVDGSACCLASSEQIRASERDPVKVRAQRELARINNEPRRRMSRRERKERASRISHLESVSRNLS